MRKSVLFFALLFGSLSGSTSNAQRLSENAILTIERAMGDELSRATAELHLKGLIDPFFISYSVTDQQKIDVSAQYGAITRSNDDHLRYAGVRLLVGDYQFNDENYSAPTSMFSMGGGPDNSLPLDENYDVIRQTLWLSTDDLFKSANENLTKKKAAYEHKQLANDVRDLADFAKAPAAHVTEAPIKFTADKAHLEEIARSVSAIFSKHREIQSSRVEISANNTYMFIRNTEGSVVRKPAVFSTLKISAETQAVSDGEPLGLSYSVATRSVDEFPSVDELVKQAEALAGKLEALRVAPRFGEKEYAGPVLFINQGATDYLSQNLLSRLYAKREDVLGGADFSSVFGSAKSASLKEKINTRVLPVTMSVTDLSGQSTYEGKHLLGYYGADDEGVKPTMPLKLVENGILKSLYMTRTPTKEIREPNGHSRTVVSMIPGIGGTVAAPGVVLIEDKKPRPLASMKMELLKRAKEDGYDFAVMVVDLQDGAGPQIGGDFNFSKMLSQGKMVVPSLVYKVYVKDGREELVRNAEINPPTTRDLRELIVSKDRTVLNMMLPAPSQALFGTASVPGTYIGPLAVLSPELEVHEQKQSANPVLPVVARP